MSRKNFNSSGTLTNDQSDLVSAVTRVLSEDAKKEIKHRTAEFQARRSRKDLSVAEMAQIVIKGTAASQSVADYLSSNPPTGSRAYDRPIIQNSEKYYSGADEPYRTPKQEVSDQIGTGGLSAQAIQKELLDAARQVARVWSKIIDNRPRLSISDYQAFRGLMRVMFTSLLDDEE